MPASMVGTYSVPATSSSNAASVAATRALYGLMVRNSSLIRTFPSRPPPRPDICTSSQYQSYLNNLASRVATNVSICVGPPIGRGSGADGRWGSGGGRASGGGRREAWGQRGWEKWSGFAWLSQDGKSRPLSDGTRPKNGRETPGSRSVANLDRSGRPNGRKPTRRKSNGRKLNRKKGAAGGDPYRCDELFA